jgi:peroxiredoxin
MADASGDGTSLLERPLVRGLLAIVLLAALAGVFFAVKAAQGGDPASRVDAGPTATGTAPATPAGGESGLGALDSQAPIVGEMAPDFELRRIDGTTVRLSDLRGKVVYVNFWASWCVPCRKELPDIQAIYDEKRGDGLEVLAVNVKDDSDTATAFFSGRNLTLPLLLDRDGSVYDQYKLQGLPDSFFVDRDGRIASLQYGQVTPENIRDRLATAGLP